MVCVIIPNSPKTGKIVFIIAKETETDAYMDPVHETGIERWVIPGRSYPSSLPDELLGFYCYTRDGGHSIIVYSKMKSFQAKILHDLPFRPR